MASIRMMNCSICEKAKSKLTMLDGALYCTQCMEEMIEEDINYQHQPENDDIKIEDENSFDDIQQQAGSLGEAIGHDEFIVVIKDETEFDEEDHATLASVPDISEDIGFLIESDTEEPQAAIDIKEEITIEETQINIDGEHVAPENAEEKLSCSYCGLHCRSYREYRIHVRQSHPDDRKVACSICYFTCKGEKLYKAHIQEEHDGFECMCKICQELYHLGDGKSHRQKCIGRLLFHCKSCKGYYGKKESVWKHLDAHNIQENDKESSFIELRIKEQFYVCKICEDNKAFRQGLYWKHIKSVHQGHHLRCKHCPKTFKTTGTRSSHTCIDGKTDSTLETINSTFDYGAQSSEKRQAREFKCPECPKIYSRGFRLNEHIQKKHHQEAVSCDICGVEFGSKYLFKYHRKTAHTDPKYNCPYCPKKFHFTSNYRRHIATHQKDKYQEPHKNPSKNSQPTLRSQPVSVPSSSLKVQNASEGNSALRIEEERGTAGSADQPSNAKSKQILKCNYCGFQFVSYVEYRAHLKESHPEDRKVACSICFFSCQGDTLYRKHIQEKHDGFECMCKICLELYNLGTYDNHKKQCQGRLVFQCNSCEECYGKRESLWKHLDGHAVLKDNKQPSFIECRIKEQFYNCKICEDDKLYKHAFYWKHIKNVHKGCYMRCRKCPKIFKTSSARSRHVCTGETDHQADVQVNSGLKRKLISHQKRPGVMEFKCPECPKVYNKGFRLNEHIKASHRISPVTCEDCGKVFRTRKLYRYHRAKIHTEPRFQCSICQKKFHYNSTYQTHMLTHQNGNNTQTHSQQLTGESGESMDLENSTEQTVAEVMDDLSTGNSMECDTYDEMIAADENTNDTITTDQSSVNVEDGKIEGKKRNLKVDCTYCGLKCSTHPEYKIHVRANHSEVRTVYCSICFLVCKGETLYRKHLQEKHDGFECMCKICLELYRLGQYNKHKKQCLGRQLFQCHLCKVYYGKKENLWQHLDEHDVSEDSKDFSFTECRINEQFYSCVICDDEKAYEKDLYWEHVKTLHKGHYLRCKYCTKTFRSLGARSRHTSTECQSNPSNKVAKRPRECLTNPTNRDTEPNAKEYKCPDCPKIYTRNYTLSQHIRLNHNRSTVKCETCGDEFKAEGLLKYHMITAHTEPKYNCHICKEKFFFAVPYHKHLSTMHPTVKPVVRTSNSLFVDSRKLPIVPKEFKCPECPKTYSKGSRLNDHIKSIHHHTPETCEICGVELKNRKLYRYHKTMVHTEPRFECSQCSKKFHFPATHRRHMESHQRAESSLVHHRRVVAVPDESIDYYLEIKEEPVDISEENATQCDTDAMAILSELQAALELKAEITTDEDTMDETTIDEGIDEKEAVGRKRSKRTICLYCGIDCGTTTGYQNHIKESHPEDRKVFCSICFIRFKGETLYRAHLQEKHNGFECMCKICHDLYHVKRYEDHKKQCKGRLLFQCNKCMEYFGSKESVLKHQNDQHDIPLECRESSFTECRIKQRFFSCIICQDDKAYEEDLYWEHVKDEHNGHYLRCKYCPKTFKNRNTQSAHTYKDCKACPPRESNVKREIKCTLCPKMFRFNDTLRAHMRATHPLFECKICKVLFKSRVNLRYHEKTTHDEPSYSCPFCTKKFHFITRYRRHVRTHKVEKFITCEVCGRGFRDQNTYNYHWQTMHQQDEENKKKLTRENYQTTFASFLKTNDFEEDQD